MCDKRDYPKINIFVGGTYVASTTWSRTCREAKANYIKKYPDAKNVAAWFDKTK